MPVKHSCCQCGSDDLSYPTTQATTGILSRCNKCGALMSPNVVYTPPLFVLNPQTGGYEEVSDARQD